MPHASEQMTGNPSTFCGSIANPARLLCRLSSLSSVSCRNASRQSYWQVELSLSFLCISIATLLPRQQARLLNGLCLVALDRLKEATRELEAVYQADPHNLAAAYALATTYLGTGDTEKARELADAVFSKVDSAESYLIFGSLRLAGKEFADAIKDFSAAVSLNPGLPLLHSQLGNAYSYSGEREQAKKEFTEELEINPRDFNANYRLGRLLREDGNVVDAAARLQTALQLRPDDTSTLYEKAQLLQSQSKTEMAVDCPEHNFGEGQDFSPAPVFLARLYYKLKRPGDAERERSIIARLNAEEQTRQPTPDPKAAKPSKE